ncbi:PAS domain S-box protein [Natronolimnobius sp. AArcel1]|uniref:PAS domain S-box protein n=1 Tax=Natronolimnobius sp. AArcel1 TaxID=1679093 RepID=UPI0013E9CF89|nr:PAS domain S-box protein [Natronolimnobius sp. AArcel1]NGM71279.1 PAS domain S-box protein [Natronolimnobius sp. AArcel1]
MTDPSEDTSHVIEDAQFRLLIDKANDGLFLIDPETGQIQGANQTVCDWLGYTKDEVLDMTIFDCQTTFSEPEAWQTFVQRVRDENGVQIKNKIQTDTGSMISVEGSISVVSVDGSDYVVAIPRLLSDQE